MYYSINITHKYAVDINLQTSGDWQMRIYIVHSCCGEMGINVFSFYDLSENRSKLIYHHMSRYE